LIKWALSIGPFHDVGCGVFFNNSSLFHIYIIEIFSASNSVVVAKNI
jgi:hypothetical protein